jgi:arylsulfatase A
MYQLLSKIEIYLMSFRISLSKLFYSALIISFFSAALISCKKDLNERVNSALQSSPDESALSSKPNIILILADDLGYEVPQFTGGQSYSTPNLNFMAANGTRFTQAYSHPDGFPSRLAIQTGKYNFRNYVRWGQLPNGEKTIGNMLHDAGYATCFTGKWQMDGFDAGIKKAGYDKYRVFLPGLVDDGVETQRIGRYKSPILYENGAYLSKSVTNNKYSEDLYIDYISKFIDDNKTKPFFVVYAQNLVGNPWVPTPDDPEFATWDPQFDQQRADKKYFASNVKYMDKMVGKVIKKVSDDGLKNNTVIIYLTDNSTSLRITSLFNGTEITGGHAAYPNPLIHTRYGTSDPLVAYWPSVIPSGRVSATLIDYTDILPTLADIAAIPKPSTYGILDGISFFDNLTGVKGKDRGWVFCHWDNNLRDAKPVIRYVNDATYKLYDNIDESKNFFNIAKDSYEKNPIPNSLLTPEEKIIKNNFKTVLSQMHK